MKSMENIFQEQEVEGKEATSKISAHEYILSACVPFLLVCLIIPYGFEPLLIPIVLFVYLQFIVQVFRNRGSIDALMFTAVSGTLLYGGVSQSNAYVSTMLITVTLAYFFALKFRTMLPDCSYGLTQTVLCVWLVGSLCSIPPHMLMHEKSTGKVVYTKFPRFNVSPFSYKGRLEPAPPLEGVASIRDSDTLRKIRSVTIRYRVNTSLLTTFEKWNMLRYIQKRGVILPFTTLTHEVDLKTAVLKSLKEAYPYLEFTVTVL